MNRRDLCKTLTLAGAGLVLPTQAQAGEVHWTDIPVMRFG